MDGERDGRKREKEEGRDEQMNLLLPSKSKPPSFLTGTNYQFLSDWVSILAQSSPFYSEYLGIF